MVMAVCVAFVVSIPKPDPRVEEARRRYLEELEDERRSLDAYNTQYAIPTHAVPPNEIAALNDLYTATNGQYWKLSRGWNSGTDPCTWYGKRRVGLCVFGPPCHAAVTGLCGMEPVCTPAAGYYPRWAGTASGAQTTTRARWTRAT